MDNISNNPRPWGGGNHLAQTDIDNLEVRKTIALERIADALDGKKTSSASGVSIEDVRPVKHDSSGILSGLFNCFRF